MFKKFTNGCVRVVNRWLPDPFLFAVILSIVVFIAGMIATKQGPIPMLSAWGGSKGFWGLLSFSMQMALVLVLGSAMASSKPCKKALRGLAGMAHTNMQAIVITTFVSTICCWLNWGFGLIAGALLAKEVAKRVPSVDYPRRIASAYSGFGIWHAGLSGSIPLQLNGGYTVFAGTAQEATFQALTTQTIFHPMNLIMVGVILVAMPFVNYAMHPTKENTICVDPALLVDETEKEYEVKSPADKMEHSRILWVILVVAGFAYIVYYFYGVVKAGKNIAGALDLNIVNFLFMFLGILLHGDLRRYVDAIGEAASGAAGILLQFPFYAGIMGMMTAANASGVSLASVISDFFVSISNSVTFPMLTFLSAGIVNFFVPSGGGQWAVQGPIVMPAAQAMGIEPGRAAMAIAWGDQWTNMIQPFWALPALGVAKLSAKDIMGYLVIVTLFVGVVACLGFLAWAAFFG
ncbi:MAG: short-chain fatty acid transporter [Clostridiales bacterium]|nr:short-chain fatty acid transporter [Clostridiales bacterium]